MKIIKGEKKTWREGGRREQLNEGTEARKQKACIVECLQKIAVILSLSVPMHLCNPTLQLLPSKGGLIWAGLVIFFVQ